MKKTSTKKTTKKSKPSGDDELPGYPKYPAGEDIMNRAKRIAMDVDGTTIPDVPETTIPASDVKTSNKEKFQESDVTKEDLKALQNDENAFEGDDEVLQDRVYPVDFAGEDLDVPGSELDDEAERTGNEDEENNIYSLGGENHEDLEADKEGL